MLSIVELRPSQLLLQEQLVLPAYQLRPQKYQYCWHQLFL